MSENKTVTLREYKKIIPELEPSIYPETSAFIALHETDEFSPYGLASALVQCDRNTVMPRALFDLIADLYKEAIPDGDSDAMNDLGALYYDGRGCCQDYEKAVYYYKMAAKFGNRKARENLGYCCYYGRSVPVDYEKAYHWFALGAFEGSIISLYKIGDMYLNGYYVDKNEAEAFSIYDRCAGMLTDESAPYAAGPVFLRLGSCFLNGTGAEANAKSALICFQQAERYLYDMVAGGDEAYVSSLQAAVEGQEKAREKLASALHGHGVIFD